MKGIVCSSSDGETYEADRVIVATNLQTELLEALGFQIG